MCLYHLPLALFGHIYYDENKTWETVEWDGFSAARGGIACAHVDDQVYLFGGRLYDREVRYGQKCCDDIKSNDDCHSCELVASMQYGRSNFHVSRLYGSGSYLLIMGGTTEEAQQHVEVFHTKTDSFITTLPLTIGSLNRHAFTPVMLSNVILTLIGGINSENNEDTDVIEYMDLSQLLIYEASPCLTTYTDCTSIDEYLLNSVERIVFDVYDIEHQRFTVRVFISNLGYSHDYQFERQSDNTLSVGVISRGTFIWATFSMDLDELSMHTNINMTNDHYVLWIEFGFGVDLLSSIGFGDIVGENRLWDYCESPKLNKRCQYVRLDVSVIGVYEISVCDATFTFRSDSCSLALQVTDVESFAIGDSLNVITNWSLTDATSLRYPVYISSDDIYDSDYVMTIHDSTTITSLCKLCRVSNTSDCVDCDQGLQISDLRTYDIRNNSYKISVFSEYENTNPKESEIILQREVQAMQFDIHTPSNQIYPGSAIFITPNPDYNKTVQTYGNFIIELDEHLSFTDNRGALWMDFENDICALIYANQTINCYEEPIIVPWTMAFKDIATNSYNVQLTSLDTTIIGSRTYEFSRQIQQISVNLSDSIYLGQNIDVFIAISDNHIVQKSSSVIISNDAHNIYSIIQIEYNTTEIESCIIDSPNMDVTTTCDQGIPLKVSTPDIINDFINLTVTSADTYIGGDAANHPSVLIRDCGIGDALFGSRDTSFICSPCALGSVGLVSGSECFECDDTNGIQCVGRSNLIVSYNYWVKIADDGSIISNFCPSGHCCRDINGCNYTDTSMLCAVGRDSSAPLCGKCMDGYSEVFGSSSCKPCDENRYSLLLIPIVLAFVFVILMLILDPPPKPIKPSTYEEVNYLTQLSVDDLKALLLCVLRPLLYYYQALSFVTIQNGLFFYLSPLVQLLSLDFFESMADEEGTGVCFLTNLSSLNKELLYLFFPFCMFVAIAVFALIHLCVKPICKKANPGPNGVMTVFIILVGNIISTMLKILACFNVDGDYVHFYSGDVPCGGPFWWGALVSVAAIIMIWICIWFKLYAMDADERASRNATLRPVTKNYKRPEWYWEFVLLSRRIIIALMVTIQYFDYDVIQYVLLLIIVLYGFVHCVSYPFKYDRVNKMETLCLFLLFIALSTTIFEFHLKYPTQISIVMSAMVAAPLVLLCVYFVGALTRFFAIKSDATVLEKPEYIERIKKWRERLDPSQQSAYDIINSKSNVTRTNVMMDSDDDDRSPQRVNSKIVAKMEKHKTLNEVVLELAQCPTDIKMKSSDHEMSTLLSLSQRDIVKSISR